MDKKGIIAIVLCAVILLVYFPYILPLISPPPEEQTSGENGGISGETEQGDIFRGLTPANEYQSLTKSAEPEATVEETPVTIGSTEETGIPLQDHIVLQNENIIARWTNDGAALKSIVLRNYKDKTKTKEMELIMPSVNDYLPLSITKIRFLHTDITEEISLATRRFKVIANTSNKVIFQTTLKNGLQITKKISLDPDAYHLNMELVFKNKSDQELTYGYQMVASSGIAYEGDPKMDMSAVVGIDKGRGNGSYKLIKTVLKDLPEKNESVGISWAGTVNKYFAVILKPASNNYIYSTDARAIFVNGVVTNDFMVTVQTKAASLPPHNEISHSYIVYTGPKLERLLSKFDIESLLGFGIFKVISRVLLKILNGVYTVIPNYGVAILFMTLAVKLLLFPLTRKSQTSMFKMQGLQPEIEKLKAKYKNDKQSMAKAQMQLFKKHGANPLGGCLPMVLQMPIFFALFRTLQLSFEMRQAPFTLWITDLSLPDTLITLPFSIPLLGNMLNILPLIMTGASFIQMRLNPKTPTADPQAKMQQKMMSFMPLMFCFILYKMPSGLTLYWTTSTIFSIGENLFIRNSLKKLKNKTLLKK
ncbi:MAG: membrane protein insertase YidC [Candidatus Anammoxibacter sp.]